MLLYNRCQGEVIDLLFHNYWNTKAIFHEIKSHNNRTHVLKHAVSSINTREKPLNTRVGFGAKKETKTKHDTDLSVSFPSLKDLFFDFSAERFSFAAEIISSARRKRPFSLSSIAASRGSSLRKPPPPIVVLHLTAQQS